MSDEKTTAPASSPVVSSPPSTPRVLYNPNQLLVDAAHRLREDCLSVALRFDNLAKDLARPDTQQLALRHIFTAKQDLENISDYAEDLATLIKLVRRLYSTPEEEER